jgi:hypothetical protein
MSRRGRKALPLFCEHRMCNAVFEGKNRFRDQRNHIKSCLLLKPAHSSKSPPASSSSSSSTNQPIHRDHHFHYPHHPSHHPSHHHEHHHHDDDDHHHHHDDDDDDGVDAFTSVEQESDIIVEHNDDDDDDQVEYECKYDDEDEEEDIIPDPASLVININRDDADDNEMRMAVEDDDDDSDNNPLASTAEYIAAGPPDALNPDESVEWNIPLINNKQSIWIRWLICSLFTFQSMFRLSDRALDALLVILSVAFTLTRTFDEQLRPSSSSSSSLLNQDDESAFPKSVYRARQCIGLSRRTFESDPFSKYVLCRKCSSIWKKPDILAQCREHDNYTCRTVIKRSKILKPEIKQREEECKRDHKPILKRHPVHDYDIINTQCEWQLFNSRTVSDVNSVTAANGDARRLKKKYEPRAIFPYFSIINAIHQILLREGAENLINNHWRRRKTTRMGNNDDD